MTERNFRKKQTGTNANHLPPAATELRRRALEAEKAKTNARKRAEAEACDAEADAGRRSKRAKRHAAAAAAPSATAKTGPRAQAAAPALAGVTIMCRKKKFSVEVARGVDVQCNCPICESGAPPSAAATAAIVAALAEKIDDDIMEKNAEDFVHDEFEFCDSDGEDTFLVERVRDDKDKDGNLLFDDQLNDQVIAKCTSNKRKRRRPYHVDYLRSKLQKMRNAKK